MQIKKRFFKVLNAVVNTILQSPFHRLLSSRLMIITYAGVKSARLFHVPVSYFAYKNHYYCFTDGAWWHNFKTPHVARLLIQGEVVKVKGVASRDNKEEFIEVMRALIDKFPWDARYYGIALDGDKAPRQGELERAWNSNVMVKFTSCAC